MPIPSRATAATMPTMIPTAIPPELASAIDAAARIPKPMATARTPTPIKANAFADSSIDPLLADAEAPTAFVALDAPNSLLTRPPPTVVAILENPPPSRDTRGVIVRKIPNPLNATTAIPMALAIFSTVPGFNDAMKLATFVTACAIHLTTFPTAVAIESNDPAAPEFAMFLNAPPMAETASLTASNAPVCLKELYNLKNVVFARVMIPVNWNQYGFAFSIHPEVLSASPCASIAPILS